MEKPRPPIDAYNRPFWEGLKARKLTMPRCRACYHIQYPMGPVCSECLGDAFDWVELSGRGTVWGYAVYHHVFHPAFAGDVPYNVAMVALREGPMVASNIVGIANEEIRNDMAVLAAFDDIDEAMTLLRFRPE